MPTTEADTIAPRWSGGLYWPDPRRGLHPYLPDRLGMRKVLGLLNPSLGRLIEETDAFTLMPARNRLTLHREATAVLANGVSGDFVEVGVHRGGSAAVLASLLNSVPHRKLHLFDRWGDLPEPTQEDGVRAEEYRKDRIEDKLRRLREQPPLVDAKHVIHDLVGFPTGRACYYEGWYHETLDLTQGTYAGGPIAFASLDCDYYESMVLAIAFFLRHASPGAVAVVDDYGSWPGANRAVHAAVLSKDDVTLQTLGTGTAVLRVRRPH